MPQMVIREERGWAGHFICADQCQFRRNTLLHRVDDDVRIVVSTVGAQVTSLPENRRVYTTIGCERVFETQAFHAKWKDPYWDADVHHSVSFESEWCIEPAIKDKITSKELVTFEMDAKANEMHEAVVSEILERLEAGEAFEKDEEDEEA